jgi:ATP adenylyltransferase
MAKQHALQRLWAPWRMEYIESHFLKKAAGCVFCNLFSAKDRKESLVLFRSKTIFVVMNRYPYTNGHLLIIPRRHIAHFESLNEKEQGQVMKLTSVCLQVLKKTIRAQGFNLGCNLERVAGAGIAEHIHFHVVPRWLGDTNFMTVVGETRLLSEQLQRTYAKLLPEFQNASSKLEG